jgi:hypothetical protein
VFQDEAPLLRAHAHPALADTWTAAVNSVDVESEGSRPDRPVYLRGGGRLDGIGRRAIGDMVSSAVASSSRFRRLLEKQPAQALSRDIGARANRVDYTFAALDAALPRRGSGRLSEQDAIYCPAPGPAWKRAPGAVCPAKMDS